MFPAKVQSFAKAQLFPCHYDNGLWRLNVFFGALTSSCHSDQREESHGNFEILHCIPLPLHFIQNDKQ